MISELMQSAVLLSLAVGAVVLPLPPTEQLVPTPQTRTFALPAPHEQIPVSPELDRALLEIETAYSCSQQLNYIDAILIYRKAIPVLKQHLRSNSKLMSAVYSELASCYVHVNSLQLADDAAKLSLDAAINCPQSKSEELAVTCSNLAVIKSMRKDFGASQELFARGLHYVNARRSVSQRIIFAILEVNFADMYINKGDEPAALRLYQHARRLLAREADPGDPVIVDLDYRIRSLKHPATKP